MIAGHGACVAREVEHFMEVADYEWCHGGFKEREAVT
jgi:hypothetical protein